VVPSDPSGSLWTVVAVIQQTAYLRSSTPWGLSILRAIRAAGASASAVALLATLAVAPSPARAEPATASAGAAVAESVGTYKPVGPARLLDTRSGLGAPAGAVTDNKVTNLQVTGLHGVPATGVSAVVLNVTVTAPNKAGHLTVYPAGAAQPVTSNLNFIPGRTIANSVTVPVGTGGRVAILHRGGSTHIIADVTGYYIGADDVTAGSEYYPLQPERILDTRDPSFGGRLPGGYTVWIPVDFGDFYNPFIRAVAVNLTAVSPVGSGHLTSWSGVGNPPNTSTLDFTANRTVPNMAIVPVGPCPAQFDCAGLPSIAILNRSSGGTHVLADLVGVFDESFDGFGLRFRPINPTRITDTRINVGASGTLNAGRTVSIATPPSVTTPNTEALSMNVTAAYPTANTHVIVWPDFGDGSRPNVSNLNPAAGETVPNAAITGIGFDYRFNVYNNAGSLHLIVDVSGTFEYPYGRPTGADAGRGSSAGSASGRSAVPQPAIVGQLN